MAPPRTRRPGFSRRAQFSLFIGYVVAVAGVFVAVMLLVISVVDPRGFSALRGLALDATTPFTAAGRGVVRFFDNSGESIGFYFFAASQNAEIKAELDASRQKLVEARAIAFENKRLKRLLKLSEESTDDVATARIVGSSFDSTRRLATLSAGSASGITVGQPVRAAEGLIGRVIETGRFASRVLLITDGSNAVPVQLVRDGTPALAAGRGDGTLDLKPLEVGVNPFRRGDIFVTSGTGGVYPPNIPVAIVIQADRDNTVARPLADPARIDFAIVQKIFQPLAMETLDGSGAAAKAIEPR